MENILGLTIYAFPFVLLNYFYFIFCKSFLKRKVYKYIVFLIFIVITLINLFVLNSIIETFLNSHDDIGALAMLMVVLYGVIANLIAMVLFAITKLISKLTS